MRKNQVDFALDMVIRSEAWRDIVRQIRGNEITDGTGEAVAKYVMDRVSESLSVALVDAKKVATA